VLNKKEQIMTTITKILTKLIKLQTRMKLLPYSHENSIFTHLTLREKYTLLYLSRKCKGRHYVEIGSYMGASSCFIAAGIKKSRRGALYCIDTWQNEGMSEGCRDTFEEFRGNTVKYKEFILPLKGTSHKVAENFTEKVDFLFIDGDHSYEGVKSDVDDWFPKLNNSAIVIFHDNGWAEGVQRVIKESVRPHAKKDGCLPNMYWAWLRD
jgi:predicted O-methyltransferase YrrM